MVRVPTTRVSVSSDNLDIVNLPLAQIQPTQIAEATLMAVQQHMAQQAAFSQIPDAVKNVSLTMVY